MYKVSFNLSLIRTHWFLKSCINNTALKALKQFILRLILCIILFLVIHREVGANPMIFLMKKCHVSSNLSFLLKKYRDIFRKCSKTPTHRLGTHLYANVLSEKYLHPLGSIKIHEAEYTKLHVWLSKKTPLVFCPIIHELTVGTEPDDPMGRNTWSQGIRSIVNKLYHTYHAIYWSCFKVVSWTMSSNIL